MKNEMNATDFLCFLASDAGMKIDKRTYIGSEAVSEAITAMPEIFSHVVFAASSHAASYGYNDVGHPVKIYLSEDRIQRIVILTKIPQTRKIKLTVAYDGTRFYGFQSQKDERTVQNELEKAISEMNGEPTRCHGASRTDTGVHAKGQVVDFETKRSFTEKRWLSSLDKMLPKDIRIIDVAFVHPLFHSRFDVWKKEYRYTLNTGDIDPRFRHTEWPIGPIADLEALRENLKMLEGTHDFTSFAKGEKDDMVRTIYEAGMEETPGHIDIVIIGNGFLHHMIRLIVFQLVEIANHRIDMSINEMIEEHSRRHTVRMAPPNGLCLTKIEY